MDDRARSAPLRAGFLNRSNAALGLSILETRGLGVITNRPSTACHDNGPMRSSRPFSRVVSGLSAIRKFRAPEAVVSGLPVIHLDAPKAVPRTRHWLHRLSVSNWHLVRS